jgi:hypothetical protein
LELLLGELVLAYAAQGALEISRHILPLGTGSDAGLGAALRLVIDPAANVTNIFHNSILLFWITELVYHNFRNHATVFLVAVFLYVRIIPQKPRQFCDFVTKYNR